MFQLSNHGFFKENERVQIGLEMIPFDSERFSVQLARAHVHVVLIWSQR